MANWTRRSFLRRAGFTAGTVLSVGSLMQLLSASAAAEPVTVAAPVIAAQAGGDALAAAKALIAASTAHVTTWDGPTDGPKAQPGKFIVYPSQDQRNGGALGVGDGVKEACAAMGWQFRLIDGQGTTNGQTAAIQQAIALRWQYNIRVINLSLGRPVTTSYQHDPLCQAVQQAWQAGIVVVVAAVRTVST